MVTKSEEQIKEESGLAAENPGKETESGSITPEQKVEGKTKTAGDGIRARIAQRFSRTTTSLYIDDTNIKLLIARGRRITCWATVPLEDGLVHNGVIADPEKVAAKINELFTSKRTSKKRVIVGLSGLNCLSKVIKLPSLADSVLAEAIYRESERELPMPLEDLYLSWHVISRTNQEIKAFLVACGRNAIDMLVKTLYKANIKPYLMDLAPLALGNIVAKPDVAIIDVRASQVDILILVDGVPELVHTVPLQSDQSLQTRLSTVREEFERTMQFYNANRLYKPLEALPIFAAGEAVDDWRLFQSLMMDSGHQVQPLVSPLKYVSDFDPAHYMINIGLLLKKINLSENVKEASVNLNILPDVYRGHRSWSKVLVPSGSVIGLAALVFIGINLQNVAGYTSFLRKGLDTTEQQLMLKQAETASLHRSITGLDGQISDASAFYQSLSGANASLSAQQQTVNGDLRMTTQVLLPQMELTGISIFGEILTLNGNAAHQYEVTQYARLLEESGRFSSVLVAVVKNGEAQRTDFTLVLRTGR